MPITLVAKLSLFYFFIASNKSILFLTKLGNSVTSEFVNMADDNKAPLSFNFKRKSDSQKLAVSKLRDDTVEEVSKDVDYIKNVEDNKINGW